MVLGGIGVAPTAPPKRLAVHSSKSFVSNRAVQSRSDPTSRLGPQPAAASAATHSPSASARRSSDALHRKPGGGADPEARGVPRGAGGQREHVGRVGDQLAAREQENRPCGRRCGRRARRPRPARTRYRRRGETRSRPRRTTGPPPARARRTARAAPAPSRARTPASQGRAPLPDAARRRAARPRADRAEQRPQANAQRRGRQPTADQASRREAIVRRRTQASGDGAGRPARRGQRVARAPATARRRLAGGGGRRRAGDADACRQDRWPAR